MQCGVCIQDACILSSSQLCNAPNSTRFDPPMLAFANSIPTKTKHEGKCFMNNALTELGRERSETSKDVPHSRYTCSCSNLEECGSSEPSRCVC